MNKHAALAEAKRRWGPNAGLLRNPSPVVRERCAVGVYREDGSFVPIGGGRTWDAAFAYADKSPRAQAFTAEAVRVFQQKPLAGLPRLRRLAALVAVVGLALVVVELLRP